jgi:hypothetical protein
MRVFATIVQEEKLRTKGNFAINVTLDSLEAQKVSVMNVLKVNFSLSRVKQAARTASTEKWTKDALLVFTARLGKEVVQAWVLVLLVTLASSKRKRVNRAARTASTEKST